MIPSKPIPHNNSVKNRLSLVVMTTCAISVVLQVFGILISFTSNSSVTTDLSTMQRNNQIELESRHLSHNTEMNNLRSSPLVDEGSNDLASDVVTTQQQEAAEVSISSSTRAISVTGTKDGPALHNGRLRLLVGILSADYFNDSVYRKRHRDLFKLWNDPRVCSLPDFKKRSIETRHECEFIYTFVMGGNPDATPELVDDSRPMEVTNRPIPSKAKDVNNDDVVLLNIKENMNEGKSQTWMKYGAEIATEYGLDYVAKCDADSIFHLHEFFHFAYKNMPPAPYNRGMYIGALRDKAYWPRHATEAERIRYESYFGNNFEGVHLYVAGQIYIVSTDVAKFIGKEALDSKCSYCEGHEDHDISAMAFHNPEPIKLTCIGRSQRFWEHPVKGEPRWRRIWARETARMTGKLFENRLFTTNSTINDVLGDNNVINF